MKIGNEHAATWVFGYGSLVSPESISWTIDRRPEFGIDVFPARLDGYGRRWNYGSIVLRGDWTHQGARIEEGVVISLGVVADEAEQCNGVVFAVTDDELAALDWRERDYRRVDVTAAVDHEAPGDLVHEVVLYVPSPDSIRPRCGPSRDSTDVLGSGARRFRLPRRRPRRDDAGDAAARRSDRRHRAAPAAARLSSHLASRATEPCRRRLSTITILPAHAPGRAELLVQLGPEIVDLAFQVAAVTAVVEDMCRRG